MIKILGIDPGYDRLGWAILTAEKRQAQIVSLDCITTDKQATQLQRYAQIDSELQSIILKYQPNILAIEALFFSRNKTSGLKVAEARGIILSCAIRSKLPVIEYHPNTIKLTVTGDGKASKAAMAKMIKLQLGLKTKELLDDTIDAVAVAFTHALAKT